MPTVVSQQGPLGTSAGSRGGGVAALPFLRDELWWPSSVQCVMFFTTSSSASCNQERHPPSQSCQEAEVPQEAFRGAGGIGVPTATHHLGSCVQWSRKGSSSPCRAKAEWGTVSSGELAGCSWGSQTFFKPTVSRGSLCPVLFAHSLHDFPRQCRAP